MKMKLSNLALLGGFALLFAGGVILSSCEGPMGPAGPPGKDGVDGVDGVDGSDGTDGVAGNAVCLECHNLDTKAAITALWATSKHGTTTRAARYAGRNACTPCHTHEGFVEVTWTGRDTTATGFPIAQVIGCETCHEFHNSLDFENEPNHAIRTSDPVEFWTGGTGNFASNEESNLCMNCHQARDAAPDDTDPAAIIVVEEHFGPHYSGQGNMNMGVNGYEFRGAVTGGPSHQHNCVACHMGEVVGDTIGGHTFTVSVEGCAECHQSAIEDGRAEIASLLADLEAALFAAGMVDADGDPIESQEEDLEEDPPLPEIIVSYEADSVGALWNYLMVIEDFSGGAHNLDYAKALLEASIDAVTDAAR